MAELPAVPARGVRDLRRALGRARGRRVRQGRAPLRAAGRGCAADQLHAARSRSRHGVMAARFHRPAAGRLPEPGVPLGAGVAVGDRDRRRGVRRARAAVARGGRADRGRLLRRRASSTSRRHARRWPAPGRAPRTRRCPATSARREAGDRLRFRDDRGRGVFPLDVPDLVVDPQVGAPEPRLVPAVAPPVPGGPGVAPAVPGRRLGHRAAGRAARAQRRRRTCTRSTSSPPRSPTR